MKTIDESLEKSTNYLMDASIAGAKLIIHSMWIFNKAGRATCLNCHKTTKDYDGRMSCCPYCGAIMDCGAIII